jgi:hypothetical protein
MKKRKKDKARISEIVSLNEALFSLEAGNLQIEGLDRRLELAIAAAGNFVCDTFTCGTYSGTCGAFACGTFKIKP